MRILLCGPLLLAPICSALVCSALVFFASFLPAHAASPPPAPSPATLCEQAIAGAELRGRTPPGMLAAIGQVESGRPDPKTGAVRPWPWTIDVGGQGQFFATKVQAMDAVAALQAQGVRSVDVGCMQVNLMQHPDAFASLAEAFDPGANAAYAVRFLSELYRQTKDWPKSVAAYHSLTPDIAADYQRRVLAIWRQPMPMPAGPAVAAASANGLVTPDAASGLVYGTYGPSRRVFGLILPAGP